MVLIDSSVWIAYFKGAESALSLNGLIDTNNICVNDLILAWTQTLRSKSYTKMRECKSSIACTLCCCRNTSNLIILIFPCKILTYLITSIYIKNRVNIITIS